jgi:soluble lytic murein transglycosylase-like protein
MVIRTAINRITGRTSAQESVPQAQDVPDETRDLVARFSIRYAIPRQLLAALMQVESGGDPWATRFEPGYRWLWDVREDRPYKGAPESIPAPRFVSGETELMQQRTSWGLLQVMGATARELGYRGRFLAHLCDPEFGMEYGCRYIQTLHSRFGTQGWEAVTAAYNAGSPRRASSGAWVNAQYIERVRAAGGLA